jgi:hypothetical protein
MGIPFLFGCLLANAAEAKEEGMERVKGIEPSYSAWEASDRI